MRRDSGRAGTIGGSVLAGGSLLLRVSLGFAALLAVGCPHEGDSGDGDDPPGGTVTTDPNQPPVKAGDWYRPEAGTTWQWQLQRTSAGINSSYAVDLYDVDLYETSAGEVAQLQAAGFRVIAYFSAGTYEDFRPDTAEFRSGELGETLADHPSERWLDVRSENVLRIMLARLDLAAEKGFDGVEPDNVDGYSNSSGFPLTGDDQLAFNRAIANAAHERGLSVGLKNDLDQVLQLVEYFDFAVNEQCHEYDECDALQPFLDAGKPVFNAEYRARYVNDAAARSAVCADAAALGIRTLVLPIELDDSFRFSCDP